MDQISDFTKVFKGKVTEAEQVKDILEKNKITSFPQKENMGHLFSLSGGHGGVRPVKLMVRTENIDQVKNIINIYFAVLFYLYLLLFPKNKSSKTKYIRILILPCICG